MSLSTHVLDTSEGRPAAGVEAVLERQGDGGAWTAVARGRTDADGRIKAWQSAAGGGVDAQAVLARGHFRLTFDVAGYYAGRALRSFYRSIPIQFVVEDPAQHHHVPLLLSPFGYSTYRGS
jgi:5-hydroxyisourate hydrolase